MSTAPSVARWLLAQFGCSGENDAIMGDLDEQFQNGRSRRWYWRQVVKAIRVGVLAEVGNNKRLAVRALVVGWACVFTYAVLWRIAVHSFVARTRPDSEYAYQLFVRFLPSYWWRYHLLIDMLVTLTVAALLACMAGAMTGWIVARSHSSHRKPFLILFAASQVPVVALWFTIAIAGAPDSTRVFQLSMGLLLSLLNIGCSLLGCYRGGGRRPRSVVSYL